MNSRRRRAWSSKGAAAVEFAIVVPLLLLVLLGLIDLGRLLFVQVSLNAASREGARASSLGLASGQVDSIVQQSSPGTARLSALGDASLQVTSIACPTNPTGQQLTTVTVTASYQWVTGAAFLGVTDINQLSSESRMLCVG
jgi:Flp pilus assembly protein TadG